MNSTTTCSYGLIVDVGSGGPVLYDVIAYDSTFDTWYAYDSALTSQQPLPSFGYSNSQCITQYATTSETPLIVRDDGTVVFGIALIVFLMCLSVFGLIFPSGRR